MLQEFLKDENVLLRKRPNVGRGGRLSGANYALVNATDLTVLPDTEVVLQDIRFLTAIGTLDFVACSFERDYLFRFTEK
jgi:hypothetical protein